MQVGTAPALLRGTRQRSAPAHSTVPAWSPGVGKVCSPHHGVLQTPRQNTKWSLRWVVSSYGRKLLGEKFWSTYSKQNKTKQSLLACSPLVYLAAQDTGAVIHVYPFAYQQVVLTELPKSLPAPWSEPNESWAHKLPEEDAALGTAEQHAWKKLLVLVLFTRLICKTARRMVLMVYLFVYLFLSLLGGSIAHLSSYCKNPGTMIGQCQT